MKYTELVEKWGVFELCCEGKAVADPFAVSHIRATFLSAHERKTVSGFYDGGGVYNLRSMETVRILHEKLEHIRANFCIIQTTNFRNVRFRHQNGVFPAVETG